MSIELLATIAGVAVLLVMSGLFSGTETALTAASRARMHQLERKGNKRARLVNALIHRRERLIGSILLGNNLVNILASALATSAMITLFGTAGVAYATLAMTALVLIFAEVLPKTYALQRSDRAALALAPFIRPFVFLFGPVVKLVELIVAATLRLFGIKLGTENEVVAATDELRGTLALQSQEGGIVKSDRDMLDGILDLADVDVSAIMVHRRHMVMIDADQRTSQVVHEMLQSGFTRVPMYRDDVENILGILNTKDLLGAIAEQRGSIDDIDLLPLLREPWYVPDTTTLIEQLNAFQARREHFALVVDEYGALMGLVTLEDILEEIVGEIADEHDIVRTGRLRQEPSGSYVVEGTMAIRDLNRECDWELPEDGPATIAGLVIEAAMRLPETSERFQVLGFNFEILRRQRNRITLLRIHPPAKDTHPAEEPNARPQVDSA